MNNPDVTEQQKAATPVACSDLLGVTAAKEWALELFAPLRKSNPVAWERCDVINSKVIEKIQREAYVAGLREAAKALVDPDYKTEIEETIQAVITRVMPNDPR